MAWALSAEQIQIIKHVVIVQITLEEILMYVVKDQNVLMMMSVLSIWHVKMNVVKILAIAELVLSARWIIIELNAHVHLDILEIL